LNPEALSRLIDFVAARHHTAFHTVAPHNLVHELVEVRSPPTPVEIFHKPAAKASLMYGSSLGSRSSTNHEFQKTKRNQKASVAIDVFDEMGIRISRANDS
jgi:hypothetical protein